MSTCLEIKRPKLIFTPCYPSLGVIGGGAKFTKVRLYVFLTVIISDLHQNEKSYDEHLMLSCYVTLMKWISNYHWSKRYKYWRQKYICLSLSSSFWWNRPKTVEGSQSMRRRHCCPNDPRVPVSNLTLVVRSSYFFGTARYCIFIANTTLRRGGICNLAFKHYIKKFKTHSALPYEF